MIYYSRLFQFINSLTPKFKNFGEANVILLFDVIDYIMDNGNDTIVIALSSKECLLLFVTLLKTRAVPSIQMKVLGLIKKWGIKYSNGIPTGNFANIYQNLMNSGVFFPNDYQSSYQQYVKISKPVIKPLPPVYSNPSPKVEGSSKKVSNEVDFDYVENIKFSLNPSKYEHKYKKLVKYLGTMVENISLANEIIDNLKPGEMDDSLKEVVHTLRSGNNRIIETVDSGRLKDPKLMSITIDVQEDINRTMTRWESLKNRMKPEPFLSIFIEKNAMNDIPALTKKTDRHSEIVQNKLNIEPDPKVKSVDDIFDIFSNVNSAPTNVNTNMNNKPLPGNNNVNNHPMDLFDMSSPLMNLNPNMNNNMMNMNQIPMNNQFNNSPNIYQQENNQPPIMMNNMNNPNSMMMNINPNPMMPNNPPNPMMMNPNPNPLMMNNNPNPMMMNNNPNPMINNNPNPMMMNNNPNPMMNNNPNPMMNQGMNYTNQNMNINMNSQSIPLNNQIHSTNIYNQNIPQNPIQPPMNNIQPNGAYPSFDEPRKDQPLPQPIDLTYEEKLKQIDSLF